ncbi:MAG TPA: tetratricopeptide repeat protein, partial [Candidatus Atribacteria bacterium]|nr:tetratricopeptide repeat protein [Candidatus Atribacteria bacterium]
MKTSIIIFFLITIMSISLFGTNIALSGNGELTEIESQQLKILKLSKIIEEHPLTIELKEDLENYTIGLELYQQSDYQQAISELLKVKYSTLNLPLYIKSQYILGDCYRRIEDWDRAIEVYKNLVVNDPILTDYSLFYLADTYHLKGDNQESIATFKKIIENFPHSLIIAETNYQIAQIYCALNDIDSALIYYKNILENSQDDQLKGKVLLELSEIYWQEKRYIDSLNCLYEILEKNYRLKRNSEPEELLIKYLYKIKEDLKDIKIPYHIMLKCADILFKYRQYNMAEGLYMEIIKGFPVEEDISEVYYKRARSLYYKGEYKEAINQCEEIIVRFAPSEITIKADYLIANSLRALGKSHLAMDRYEKIIEKYPESYYARQSFQRLAELYFQAKETEKGISTWRDLINRYPNSYEAMNSLWNLARYYTNNNAFPEALDCYHELAERFSQSSLGDDALYWEGKT